jgi:hypothetical protein
MAEMPSEHELSTINGARHTNERHRFDDISRVEISGHAGGRNARASCSDPYPKIGEAVVVLEGLAIGHSAFEIACHDDHHATPDVYVHLGLFGDFDPNRGIGAVRDVAGFAKSGAVFHRDDEIFG